MPVDYETLLAEIVDPAPPALVRHLKAIVNGGETLTRKDVRIIAFGFLASKERFIRSYRKAIMDAGPSQPERDAKGVPQVGESPRPA